MKIAVVGTGYVGLVTGTCFAETGNQVTCVDIDKSKVERMQKGEIPIYEPHLDLLFERNINQGRLHFTTDLKNGIEDAKVIFLALPTPPGENGSADLKYILQVAEQLGHLIKNYTIVINKSTVPVGTAEKVRETISKNCTVEFDVISNPEFLREGFAVDDFMKPDRVVIGTQSERAKKVMTELYGPFVRQGNPVYFMDERSAELTKYAANAFLATKITFMNEIANLCEKVGANVDSVRIGIGTDDRIGKRFLFAGIGYGGSCFPKDVMALHHTAEEHNYPFSILKSVMEVNEKQKVSIIEKIKTHFKGELKGKKVALWGLAFKPDTDDIREAPALYIIDSLLSLGASISAYDPEAMKNVKTLIGDKIIYGNDPYEILKDADMLLIATEWSVFRTPEFEKMEKLLKNKLIFDGRNLYDLQQMKDLGFTYYSVGRNKIN
ncbi:MAG: UDP-glucose/GDP-mannose dehydrogenase family protein [Bacteroidia bacterium]|nr:UDP-glucose/GDP-mannose dehydrogenase family protein [Bacteroidota bacterium]MBK7431595.1 UDP-glucose/GDP-mannose dehydrogenase family protein [Bacteroidota bacterium]MBP9790462.1 UDP-glucose/GDP-mannose dehydrogenase family protein [Bacteroidia bacterium]MBP9923375.1 UDP-glucose/GDP-mannose dehydrogenase family protein [Bacteroidia bacterium]